MNWKQFKDHVESEGVTDNMNIYSIQLMRDGLEHYPPKVVIHHGYSKFSPKEIIII